MWRVNSNHFGDVLYSATTQESACNATIVVTNNYLVQLLFLFYRFDLFSLFFAP